MKDRALYNDNEEEADEGERKRERGREGGWEGGRERERERERDFALMYKNILTVNLYLSFRQRIKMCCE